MTGVPGGGTDEGVIFLDFEDEISNASETHSAAFLFLI